jgi:hypothetical protein
VCDYTAGIYVNDLVSDEGSIFWELWLGGLCNISVRWDETKQRWRAQARAEEGEALKVGHHLIYVRGKESARPAVHQACLCTFCKVALTANGLQGLACTALLINSR